MSIELLKFSDLVASTAENNIYIEAADDSFIDNNLDTVFTISYTSGTSGNSKGVMLTNKNFLAAITTI